MLGPAPKATAPGKLGHIIWKDGVRTIVDGPGADTGRSKSTFVTDYNNWVNWIGWWTGVYGANTWQFDEVRRASNQPINSFGLMFISDTGGDPPVYPIAHPHVCFVYWRPGNSEPSDVLDWTGTTGLKSGDFVDWVRDVDGNQVFSAGVTVYEYDCGETAYGGWYWGWDISASPAAINSSCLMGVKFITGGGGMYLMDPPSPGYSGDSFCGGRGDWWWWDAYDWPGNPIGNLGFLTESVDGTGIPDITDWDYMNADGYSFSGMYVGADGSGPMIDECIRLGPTYDKTVQYPDPVGDPSGHWTWPNYPEITHVKFVYYAPNDTTSLVVGETSNPWLYPGGQTLDYWSVNLGAGWPTGGWVVDVILPKPFGLKYPAAEGWRSALLGTIYTGGGAGPYICEIPMMGWSGDAWWDNNGYWWFGGSPMANFGWAVGTKPQFRIPVLVGMNMKATRDPVALGPGVTDIKLFGKVTDVWDSWAITVDDGSANPVDFLFDTAGTGVVCNVGDTVAAAGKLTFDTESGLWTLTSTPETFLDYSAL